MGSITIRDANPFYVHHKGSTGVAYAIHDTDESRGAARGLIDVIAEGLCVVVVDYRFASVVAIPKENLRESRFDAFTGGELHEIHFALRMTSEHSADAVDRAVAVAVADEAWAAICARASRAASERGELEQAADRTAGNVAKGVVVEGG